jgi:acetoin utilization protein AcuC
MQASLFCKKLGFQRVKVEPLAYHNAIMHEFYGFRYMTGRCMMEEIDRAFAPGGELFNRLDGSTLFRQPGFERSIRGRSWAIHDGILGKPWQCPRMYYAIDEPEDRIYDEFTCHVFSRSYYALPYFGER